MILPLVIGIGVTNGIHILNRFAEEKNPGILGKSTGKAVFISGLTTISGFGSLILARHQGIRSLGEVMSVGRRDLHDRRADIFAGVVKTSEPAERADEKTTQWRQCTIDTGSGGTEVKTSSNIRTIEQTVTKSISMLKWHKGSKTGVSLTITRTQIHILRYIALGLTDWGF